MPAGAALSTLDLVLSTACRHSSSTGHRGSVPLSAHWIWSSAQPADTAAAQVTEGVCRSQHTGSGPQHSLQTQQQHRSQRECAALSTLDLVLSTACRHSSSTGHRGSVPLSAHWIWSSAQPADTAAAQVTEGVCRSQHTGSGPQHTLQTQQQHRSQRECAALSTLDLVLSTACRHSSSTGHRGSVPLSAHWIWSSAHPADTAAAQVRGSVPLSAHWIWSSAHPADTAAAQVTEGVCRSQHTGSGPQHSLQTQQQHRSQRECAALSTLDLVLSTACRHSSSTGHRGSVPLSAHWIWSSAQPADTAAAQVTEGVCRSQHTGSDPQHSLQTQQQHRSQRECAALSTLDLVLSTSCRHSSSTGHRGSVPLSAHWI